MIHKGPMIRLLGVLFLLSLYLSFPGYAQTTLDQLENTEKHVIIILEDFTVYLQKTQVKTGWINLTVVNAGMSTHELVILRTDLHPAELPRKEIKDHKEIITGHSVNEQDVAVKKIDEIEEFPAGTQQIKKIFLMPGHYVLFCNISGHYDKGMYSSFNVMDE